MNDKIELHVKFATHQLSKMRRSRLRRENQIKRSEKKKNFSLLTAICVARTTAVKRQGHQAITQSATGLNLIRLDCYCYPPLSRSLHPCRTLTRDSLVSHPADTDLFFEGGEEGDNRPIDLHVGVRRMKKEQEQKGEMSGSGTQCFNNVDESKINNGSHPGALSTSPNIDGQPLFQL